MKKLIALLVVVSVMVACAGNSGIRCTQKTSKHGSSGACIEY